MNSRIIESICREFLIQGEYKCFNQLNCGHINTTYSVRFYRDLENKDYILQRVNTNVFKNPVEMMNNISNVTEYIRGKIKLEGNTAKRLVLHFQCDSNGKYYVENRYGFWRCYRFIENSVCYNNTDNIEIIEEAGKAFGEFQMYLADFPVEKLSIAIPHFHNTIRRYENFENAIKANKSGRLDEVSREVEVYRGLKDISTKMYRMQVAGQLPLKVTHNDTKTNNVLFDKFNNKHLAVLDLDTVMPGLVGFDFGDAIRFIANTCEEEEKNISKVHIDMEKYEAFTKGFLSKVRQSLNKYEIDTLALGAVTMTVECGIRFLTDYIDGDEYFKIDYSQHNLDRARCQLALAQDMLTRIDDMNNIVYKYLKEEQHV